MHLIRKNDEKRTSHCHFFWSVSIILFYPSHSFEDSQTCLGPWLTQVSLETNI